MANARFRRKWTTAAALALVGWCPVAAQILSSGRVRPVELVSPAYPPIAVSARISGDVTVVVQVRPDGSVADVAVTSGPPLLIEASRRAARASRFECPACESHETLAITYAFGFDKAPVAAELDASGSRVHISAPSPFVIPLFSDVSVRSAKCLYLWRCGSQWGGMDYYNYKIRSARCAWLWKCGWRRRTTSG